MIKARRQKLSIRTYNVDSLIAYFDKVFYVQSKSEKHLFRANHNCSRLTIQENSFANDV